MSEMKGGRNVIGLTLACKDLDPESNCPYVARGETMDRSIARIDSVSKIDRTRNPHLSMREVCEEKGGK